MVHRLDVEIKETKTKKENACVSEGRMGFVKTLTINDLRGYVTTSCNIFYKNTVQLLSQILPMLTRVLSARNCLTTRVFLVHV